MQNLNFRRKKCLYLVSNHALNTIISKGRDTCLTSLTHECKRNIQQQLWTVKLLQGEPMKLRRYLLLRVNQLPILALTPQVKTLLVHKLINLLSFNSHSSIQSTFNMFILCQSHFLNHVECQSKSHW